MIFPFKRLGQLFWKTIPPPPCLLELSDYFFVVLFNLFLYHLFVLPTNWKLGLKPYSDESGPEYFIADAMCFILHSCQKHVMLSYIAIGNDNLNHLVKVVLSRHLSTVNKHLPFAISKQSLYWYFSTGQLSLFPNNLWPSGFSMH